MSDDEVIELTRAWLDRFPTAPDFLHDLLAVVERHRQENERASIYDEVKAERERAHAKHGDTSMESFAWDDLTRLTVLLEEVGEVARCVSLRAVYWATCFNERRHHNLTYEEVGPSLREELVQVAAMAAAWADVLDKEPSDD